MSCEPNHSPEQGGVLNTGSYSTQAGIALTSASPCAPTTTDDLHHAQHRLRQTASHQEQHHCYRHTARDLHVTSNSIQCTFDSNWTVSMLRCFVCKTYNTERLTKCIRHMLVVMCADRYRPVPHPSLLTVHKVHPTF